MSWFIAWHVAATLFLMKTAAAFQFDSTDWQYIKLDHAFEIIWSWSPESDLSPVTLQLFVYPDTQSYQFPALTIGTNLTGHSFWWIPNKDQMGSQFTILGVDGNGKTTESPNFLVGIAPSSDISSSSSSATSSQEEIITRVALPSSIPTTSETATRTASTMGTSMSSKNGMSPTATGSRSTIAEKASSTPSSSSPPTASATSRNIGGLSSAALSGICIAAVLCFFLFIAILSAIVFHYGKKAAMKRRSNSWPSSTPSSFSIPEKPELGMGKVLPVEMCTAVYVSDPAELEVVRTACELEAHRMSELVETGWGQRAELEWTAKTGWR